MSTAAGVAAQAATEPLPAGVAERRWSSGDGLNLFARDYAAASGGSLLPVICLHGLTRNSRDFEDVAPWIAAQGRRVIAVDVRGRGLSDPDPEPLNYVPKTYVRDVIALMDALGIGRAVFIGTSMGGIIAMALAAIRPRAIAAAILNDVGPVVSPEAIERIKTYAGRPAAVANWDEAVDHVRRSYGIAYPALDDAGWEALARRSFRDVDGVPMPDYDPQIMLPFAQGRFKAPGLIAWLLFRRLARRRPTLLLRGGLSDLLTADIVARMRAHAPAMDYVEVPNIGHAPMLTEPEARSALATFLAAID